MKKKLSIILLTIINTSTNAQCAMCKAVLETGDKQSAEAVNDGITYLMVFPYILVGILTYFLIRHKRRNMDIN